MRWMGMVVVLVGAMLVGIGSGGAERRLAGPGALPVPPRPRVLANASLAPNAAFSVAVATATGGPSTQQDAYRLLADIDGREDLVADHQALVLDRGADGNPIAEHFTRIAPSAHTIANGYVDNVFYSGDSVGNFSLDFDDTVDGSLVGSYAANIPELVATGTSGPFTLSNAIPGDATSGSVVVTAIAVNPVADLGAFAPGLCGQVGEVVYVSVHDAAGGSLDASGRPIRTRLFAFGIREAAGVITIDPGVLQIARHSLGNLAGVALDDAGRLYFQLADLVGFSGAAIFQATELPHDSCATSNRVNRVVPPFLLDGAVGLDTATPATLAAGAVRLTNYSGTATTFGNAAALAGGPCNTLYAALARSRDTNDPSEGPFTNPPALGATPSMIVSLADAAGAIDTCTSPGGQQPGILVVEDGFADVARAGLAVAPGVNNFRVFALGTGPDRRASGDPVFGSAADTQKLDFQADHTIFAGLAVDEERAVYVVSGGTPANVGTNPSPAFGEILKLPDRAPADRRADFVDLRGDTPPDPPDNGGNAGDGDSDRFDHLFWPAPSDSGSPTGLAGLARGFLRYLNRSEAPNAIPNLGGLQGDDDMDGPVSFDAFDPSGQVAGGDDASAPFTGDDAASGFELAFGGLAGGVCTTPWSAFFLNSNGNVTFGAGDDDLSPSIPELLGGPPRIAPAWVDLNPGSRGGGRWSTFPLQALGFAGPNAFKIRWIQVPPFSFEACGGLASMSMTLFDDATGLDESAPPAVEGPTDQRFAGGTGAPPRAEGRGSVDFEYCRMDVLGTESEPAIVGYAVGGQDLAFPNICETDVGQAARSADPALLGAGTQRLLFEIFRDGVKPAPQVPGEVEFDLRFTGNDATLANAATQPDASRDFLSLLGPDCDTNADLTCSCVLTIDPATLPAASVVDTQLAAQGGTPPFTYAVTAGALPEGLTLGSDGRLSGPSAANGAFSFEVTATDAKSCTARRTLGITVGCAPAATFPSIGCRIDVLTTGVGVLPDGKTRKKLAKLLGAAAGKIARAEERAAAEKTKSARRLVGQVSGTLKRIRKALASKAARKQLDEATRNALAAEAAAIQGDAAALRESLG